MPLTDRDEIAARAMQAIVTGEVTRADPLTSLSSILTEKKMHRIARMAYDMADAMLNEGDPDSAARSP